MQRGQAREPAHVTGVQLERRRLTFGEHAVSRCRAGEALGADHDAGERGLDVRSRAFELSDLGRPGDELLAKSAQRALDRVRPLLVLVQEGQQPAQLGVVGRTVLAGVAERAIRRGREEQHARELAAIVAEREQLLGELGGIALAVEQFGEALELIEDHEVGLERIDAAPCELSSQSADEMQLTIAFGGGQAGAAVGGVHQREELGPEGGVQHLRGERSRDARVRPGQRAQLVLERADLRVEAEHLVDAAVPRDVPHRPQQPKQQRTLLRPSAARPRVERRPGRQRDEVHAVGLELLEMERQQRDPRRQRRTGVAVDLQALQVLLRDLLVRAHVHDVDALHAAIAQVGYRPLDHPSCDKRLPEADLVGDEEAPRPLVEQPLRHPVDRPLLEVLQPRRAHGWRSS
ncbi:MAG TPA: hypothetical protein VN238_04980 [Solirubrobacteraceae bacterium]|nr:hypothetical protein [Solirubrobacteraceae bacterium]